MSEMRIALMQELAAELRESSSVLTEHEIALIARDRAGLGTLTCIDRVHVPAQRGKHSTVEARADLAPTVALQRG